MKFPRSMKSNDFQPLVAGTQARLFLAHALDMLQERLRTQAELRAMAALPTGITLPAGVNPLAEGGTIGEAIAFSGTGNGFTAYPIVVNTGKYTDKMTGEQQHTGSMVEVDFSMILPEAEALGFQKMVANREFVAIIGDLGTSGNEFKIIGSRDIPAFVKDVTIDSGSKPGDKRVLTGKIVETSGRGMYVYPIANLHPNGLPMSVQMT
jgi:hypothetical protein